MSYTRMHVYVCVNINAYVYIYIRVCVCLYFCLCVFLMHGNPDIPSKMRFLLGVVGMSKFHLEHGQRCCSCCFSS